MIELKTTINGYKVFYKVDEIIHFGFVYTIHIGSNYDKFVKLDLMLQTLGENSMFEFCGKLCYYYRWLEVYKEIKSL